MEIQKEVLFLLPMLFILFAQEEEDFTLVCKMFMFIMTRGKFMYNTLDCGTFHRQGRILLNDTFSICKLVELIKLKVFSNMCH